MGICLRDWHISMPDVESQSDHASWRIANLVLIHFLALYYRHLSSEYMEDAQVTIISRWELHKVRYYNVCISRKKGYNGRWGHFPRMIDAEFNHCCTFYSTMPVELIPSLTLFHRSKVSWCLTRWRDWRVFAQRFAVHHGAPSWATIEAFVWWPTTYIYYKVPICPLSSAHHGMRRLPFHIGTKQLWQGVSMGMAEPLLSMKLFA